MGLLSNFRNKFHNAFFTQVLYGTMASLAIFLTSWDHLDRMRDRFQTKLQNDTDTFDFIIAGGGTSGSVLAYRLSQYYSVLLLESGGEPHPFQAVPGLALFMPNYPEIDWMHRSVPQKRAFGNSVKREASLSQGKGLGGSGNLNFLNYLRGSPHDYEHWRNITGDKTWAYNEMRKYFNLIEDYSKDIAQNNNGKARGAMKIDIPDYIGLSEEFILAAQQHGYKHVDLNDNFVEGFDVNYYPIYKGIRQAPYKSYLKPARTRKSLTIRKFATVNRVLFRDGTTQAYGVEYERHGEVKVVKAAKEVILSAGALSTPKILMVSGIGPAEHLQDVGIPLRLDLPVGRNLQDHVSTLLGPFFINQTRALLLGKDIDTRSFLAWGMDGKGPLTTSFYQASGLFLSSFANSREEDKDWPDIHLQLSSIAVHKTYAQDLAHAYNLQEDFMTQYYNHAAGKHSFSISITNGRPVARGEVLLRSPSPGDRPMINPKYLEDSYSLDVKIMRDGIKTALKLAENSTSFQSLGARFTDKRLPGCEHVAFRSNAYWECYIRQFSLSMHSYCGTAAMGKPDSKFAVVDSDLKVIGAKGLRVIDASVMPSIVVGSIQAATLAIAEKGVESILSYWRQFDVPTKKYEEVSSKNGTSSGDDDFTDSFAGFSFVGKESRTNTPSAIEKTENLRKITKTKSKSPNAPAARARKVSTVRSTTTIAPPSSTTLVSKSDFEQVAETKFSHNLNQIMEFLRNSRAINEALDEETYNELVQNFGERIVEIMKKNKTEIFFQPVTIIPTSSPDDDSKKTSRRTTTTTGRPSSTSTSFSPPVSKNNFGGFINSKTPTGKTTEKFESLAPLKSSKPLSTTEKPRPISRITTVAQKLNSYFLNAASSKVAPNKVNYTPSSTQGPQLTRTTFGPKFSPLISQTSNSNFFSKPKTSSTSMTVVTGSPKKITTTSPANVAFSSFSSSTSSFKPSPSLSSLTSASSSVPTSTAIDDLFGNTEESSTEGFEDEFASSTTGLETEDIAVTTTPKPIEQLFSKTNPPKKIYELILNPDLSINKTKEIDNLASILASQSKITKDGKKVGRELIEYRTEEVRPFPAFPPYKIFNVPGQEFTSNGQHSPPVIFSPLAPLILQPTLGIASLTPPPAPQNIVRNSHLNNFNHPHSHQITQQLQPQSSLPHFQHAQLLEPPKLPEVIDQNLPIQTAKTVLYYTQVFPRDPSEIRGSNDNNLSASNNRPVVVSSSSNSATLSLSNSSLQPNLQREDRSQNTVQFYPTIKK